MKKVKAFQIRWDEALGEPNCPYMRRWVFLFFGFGVRIHRWYRSDDKRFFHNHPFWFWTFVLKGSYTDVSLNVDTNHIKRDNLKLFNIRFRKAVHLHYVEVPKGGTITILFTGRKTQNWGFWVKDRIMRPLRFFSRYGHPPCSEQ